MVTIVAIEKTSNLVKYLSIPSVLPENIDSLETEDIFFKIVEEYSELLLSSYYKDGEFKELPIKPSEFYIWNLETESWIYSEELYKQYLGKLKTEALRKRNNLLLNSDWTELPSALVRLGETKIAEWQAYRQALRDITSQADYPENITWPEQPTN